MRFKILTAAFFLFTNSIIAQDAVVKSLLVESTRPIKKEEVDTSKKSWKKGGIYSINIGQGSLSNWAAGGDNFSLNISSRLNVYAFYKKGKLSWDNSLESNLGYIKATSLGGRKNDDRIDILSKYGFSVSQKWSLSTLLNFRSQFFKGYNYSDTIKKFTSEFLAPAYILFSLGMDYKPAKGLSIFLSPITSRWIIVKNDSLNSKGLYGVFPGKRSVKEVGAFASINFLNALTKTITYKSRLDLFSNYNHNPENIDLYMTNIFSAKLSKSLSVNYSLDMIYDDDVKLFGSSKISPALQIKSILGVGFVVKF
jgi:hypothetical protein